MELFEATPKQWGNSLGITIPSNIIKKGNIKQKRKIKLLLLSTEMSEIKKVFGSLKLKKPTQRVMEEIDEEYG